MGQNCSVEVLEFNVDLPLDFLDKTKSAKEILEKEIEEVELRNSDESSITVKEFKENLKTLEGLRRKLKEAKFNGDLNKYGFKLGRFTTIKKDKIVEWNGFRWEVKNNVLKTIAVASYYEGCYVTQNLLDMANRFNGRFIAKTFADSEKVFFIFSESISNEEKEQVVIEFVNEVANASGIVLKGGL